MPRQAEILDAGEKEAKRLKKNHNNRESMRRARSIPKEGEVIPRARITHANNAAKNKFLRELAKDESSKTKQEFKNRAGFVTTNADIIFASLSSLLPCGYGVEGKELELRDRKQELHDFYNQNEERRRGTFFFRFWARRESANIKCIELQGFCLAVNFYKTCEEWQQYLWPLFRKNYVLRYETNFLGNSNNQKKMSDEEKEAAKEYLAGRVRDHDAWLAKHKSKEAVRLQIAAGRAIEMKIIREREDEQHRLDVLARKRAENERHFGAFLARNEIFASDSEDEDEESKQNDGPSFDPNTFDKDVSYAEMTDYAVSELGIHPTVLPILKQIMEGEDRPVNGIVGLTFLQYDAFKDLYTRWLDHCKKRRQRMQREIEARIERNSELARDALAFRPRPYSIGGSGSGAAIPPSSSGDRRALANTDRAAISSTNSDGDAAAKAAANVVTATTTAAATNP